MRNRVVIAAEELIESRGIPSRGICPVCEGGSSSEESLSIWVGDGGTYFATCHRDQCSVGTVCLGNDSNIQPRYSKELCKASLPSWITTRGRYDDTSSYVWDYMRERYRYPFVSTPPYAGPCELYWISDGCAIFPMYDREARTRGYIVKRMLDQHKGPKSLTYVDTGYDGMSWYANLDTYLTRGDLYVVEDVLSAIALYMEGHSAVSLNGTRVDRTRMEELAKGKERIVLCLDADATRTAIRAMRSFYNSYNITTRRLVKDFKDMTPQEIEGWMTTHMMYA